MKLFQSALPKAIKMILIMTLLCGVIYPLIVTGISQVFFTKKANGSMIVVDGKTYGSELIGQQYTSDTYLWGRIMNLDTDTYIDKDGNKIMYSSPSNLSTASKEYKALVEERVKKIKESNPNADTDAIPVDLVTSSGSGLDPHISKAAAYYQVSRIAKSRNISEEDVKNIIDNYTTGKFLGIFGEQVVNVLQVNLALDGILK